MEWLFERGVPFKRLGMRGSAMAERLWAESQQYPSNRLKVWLVSFDGSPQAELDGNEYEATANALSEYSLDKPVQWSPDGRYVAYSIFYDPHRRAARGGPHAQVVVSDVASGRVVYRWEEESLAGSASWSWDSTHLLTSYWDVTNGDALVYRVRDVAGGSWRAVEVDPDVSRVMDRGHRVEAMGMIGNDHVMLCSRRGRSAYVSWQDLASGRREPLVQLASNEPDDLSPFTTPFPPEHWLT
jgi:hypothetical protein